MVWQLAEIRLSLVILLRLFLLFYFENLYKY
jgi:hypothetical protein